LARAREFDIHNIVPQYEEYYERVLEESRTRTKLKVIA
jgi:hypothetical protein